MDTIRGRLMKAPPSGRCCNRCGSRVVDNKVKRGKPIICRDCRSSDPWFVAKIGA